MRVDIYSFLNFTDKNSSQRLKKIKFFIVARAHENEKLGYVFGKIFLLSNGNTQQNAYYRQQNAI